MSAPFLQRALTLLANGYQIIPIPPFSKGPKIQGWQNLVATKVMAQRWSANGYVHGNLGERTDNTPGVDLDILDEPVVLRMQTLVERIVGSPLPMLVRIGKAPKRLMLFRCVEQFSKISSPVYVCPKGKEHRVEILGKGQQFVAYGTHPDTKREYEWVSESTPLNTHIDDLPVITEKQAHEIVAAFVHIAEELGWKTKRGNRMGFDDGLDDTSAVGIDMRPRLRISTQELREKLKDFPGYDDYDTWFRVGMGLHHQYQGSQEGLKLWLEWSAQWFHYDKDAEEAALYRWNRSFKDVHDGGQGPITVAFVIKAVNEAKRKETAQEFDVARTSIEEAIDGDTLLGPVAKEIGSGEFSRVQLTILSKLMQGKLKKLLGVMLPISTIQRSLKQDSNTLGIKNLEVALANRVLNSYFEDGAWIRRFGRMFWIFKDGVWVRESDDFIRRCIMQAIIGLKEVEDPMLRKLNDQMDASRGDKLSALVATLYTTLCSTTAVPDGEDPLNLMQYQAPRAINCRNCEVWVNDEGKVIVRNHNPLNFFTSQIACDYEPEANCPTWDRSIRKVFQQNANPEEMIRHWYECFGYIISPRREVGMYLIFNGPGGNGKSFLLGIISVLMGRGSTVAGSMSDLANGNQGTHFTAQLVGKLMYIDDDFKAGAMLADDWIKRLSEGKLMTADPKWASSFEFVCRAIPVILTNSWPSTIDLSEGLRRRAQVFWTRHILTPEEQDPRDLEQILTHELPGLLNHLVAGLCRFVARGCKFDPPMECDAAKAAWFASSNTTMRFASECLQRTGERRDNIQGFELYTHYKNWLHHFELNARPLGRNKFFEAIEMLGFKRVNHGHVAYFSHVKVLPITNGEFDDLDDDGLDDPFTDDGLDS